MRMMVMVVMVMMVMMDGSFVISIWQNSASLPIPSMKSNQIEEAKQQPPTLGICGTWE